MKKKIKLGKKSEVQQALKQSLENMGVKFMICPECREKISYLNKYTKVEEKSTIFPGGKNVHVDYLSLDEDEYDSSFECPECKREIFFSEDEANAFLNPKNVRVLEFVIEAEATLDETDESLMDLITKVLNDGGIKCYVYPKTNDPKKEEEEDAE